jgi:transcription initiation factor TFIIE subunit beta
MSWSIIPKLRSGRSRQVLAKAWQTRKSREHHPIHPIHSINVLLTHSCFHIIVAPSSRCLRGGSPPVPAIMQSAAMASTLKRKRDVAVSRPAIVEIGQLMSQLTTAIEYLKEKRKGHTPAQLLGYLSLQHADDEVKNRLLRELKKRPDVIFRPDGHHGAGSFHYKPKIAVSNAEELRKYLQTRPSSVGVRFDEIRDGWPNCPPAIDEMEKKGEVLIIRDRKGGAKLAWDDEPSLRTAVADSLIHSWNNIKLPVNADDLRGRLENAGLKPTSAPKEVSKKPAAKDNRKKGPRRGTRMTNVHMQHLLKDYSARRIPK